MAQNPPTDKSDIKQVLHQSYLCPALHGPNAVPQRIWKNSLRQVFETERVLYIPLFQRTYCWTTYQLNNWWRDFRSSHSLGKVIFVTKGDGKITIVDGQQRCTTGMLLLASLRDVALEALQKEEGAAVRQRLEKIVERLNNALFNDQNALQSWVAQNKGKPLDSLHAEGEPLVFSRLWPSYRDRKPYYKLITMRLCGFTDEPTGTEHVTQTYNFFHKAICQQIAASDVPPVAVLTQTTTDALDNMTVWRCDIETDQAATQQQIFLWYQERDIMGGIQVHNAVPGVRFRVVDMLRNYVMSGFLHADQTVQEKVYKEKWLPFELHFNPPSAMDSFLTTFLKSTNAKQMSRHKCKDKQNLLGMCAAVEGMAKKVGQDVSALRNYYSFVEWFADVRATAKDSDTYENDEKLILDLLEVWEKEFVTQSSQPFPVPKPPPTTVPTTTTSSQPPACSPLYASDTGEPAAKRKPSSPIPQPPAFGRMTM
eukprot:TRINITY_DN56224_c0_g1_i1.p1 TRINITY_DN56224_c0_g1~~TRINITY_DN56224_c0_g1_i1.p1  ORF type:complete len:481 (+),score=54.19 TRINITY_DN56224_c0_g1_i1:66-1508(+)